MHLGRFGQRTTGVRVGCEACGALKIASAQILAGMSEPHTNFLQSHKARDLFFRDRSRWPIVAAQWGDGDADKSKPIARWVYDLFCSLLPHMLEEDLPSDMVGDLDTLESRLEAERVAAKAFGACVGLVSAWSLKGG
jgi:hypothetical protein